MPVTIASFCAVAMCMVASAASGAPLAIAGGKLLDVTERRVSEDVLVLRGGRIDYRGARLPAEYAGEILDVGGRYVSAGLRDLHVHAFGHLGPGSNVEIFGVEGTANRMLASGVTTFLDLSGFEDELFHFRQLQRGGSAAGAWLLTAGSAFTVAGGHGTQFTNPAREVEGPEDAREQVRELASERPDVIKLIYLASHPTLPSLDRETMTAIVEEARSVGIPVVAHTSYWVDAIEAVEVGVDAITHTDSAPVPPELVALMVERGAAWIPTLAVHLGLDTVLRDPRIVQRPSYRRVSLPAFRASYSEEAELSPTLRRWRERQVAERGGLLDAVRRLHDAGVTILTGSDSGNPGTFQGASLHFELALLVEAGLDPWEALRASTVDAASFTGDRADLVVGGPADLVVFDRSPLDDISHTEEVWAVIRGGELVRPSTLDLPEVVGADVELTTTMTIPTSQAGPAAAPAETVARGTVHAASGWPLSHVEVLLRERRSQRRIADTQTDGDGAFVLAADPSTLAESTETPLEIFVGYPGFDPMVLPWSPESAAEPFGVILQVAQFQEAIVVEARSPTDEALQPQQSFDFLDIVATAGANADPLFATQTLPGVVKLDEGSGLFVRGGDASEVATFLDLALLDHPYRNETPTGGFFGTVDAFELAGLSLSAGGFPARFGNTLSAVLELETRPRSDQRALQMTLGLASASASFEAPIRDRGSVRLAANRRDARALVELNDAQLDFREPPSGTDVSGRIVWESQSSARLVLTAYEQDSALGTEIENGNFVGALDTSDANRVVNVAWSRLLPTTAGSAPELTLTLSSSQHRSAVEAGALDLDLDNEVWRARLDIVDVPLGEWSLRLGGVAEDSRHTTVGSLPDVGGDFGGAAGARLFEERTPTRREGGYLELERGIGARLAVNVGGRYDRWGALSDSAFDPRVSASLRVGRESYLRAAWGRYHQSPEVEYLSQGAQGLTLARAEHRVVSWQRNDPGSTSHVRLELYDKRYQNLPLQVSSGDDSLDSYESRGFGSARGADLYYGFRSSLGTGVRVGWRGFLAYSYLEAERLYTPWQDNDRYDPPSVAFEPDFAIPHTLQIVVHKQLPGAIDASLGARFASGRPSTPVVGVSDGAFGLRPLYGTINSERLPSFRRVDMSASRAFAVGGTASALVFVGINDVFDRRNAFRYVYSQDWSQRRVARTAFGRTVYFGFSLRR